MARIRKSGPETREPKIEKPDSENKPPLPDNQPLVPEPDYTRYGDWQIKGKCVDF